MYLVDAIDKKCLHAKDKINSLKKMHNWNLF